MKIIKSINKYMVMSVASLAFAGILSSMTYAKPNIKISSPSGKVVRVAKGKKVKLKAIVKQLKDKKVSFKTINFSLVLLLLCHINFGVLYFYFHSLLRFSKFFVIFFFN